MKQIVHIISLTLIISTSSCVYVKYHNYAAHSKSEAEITIKRLKQDTLIVIIPTYKEKERILKAAKRSARGKGNIRKAKQRILNLYAERQVELEAILAGFEYRFDFCPVLYIPDSLVYDFEAGFGGDFFINPNTHKLSPAIDYSNRSPIKLVKQFEQEWQIKINNRMIANPFPNYYIYKNGLFGFLGQDGYDRMYEQVASVFQRRFDLFYEDPDSRIAL